jgi:hypothetical protein
VASPISSDELLVSAALSQPSVLVVLKVRWAGATAVVAAAAAAVAVVVTTVTELLP